MKIKPLGHALSLFLVISLTLCILWGLIAPPNLHMHLAWEPLLPGFNWSITGYLIGLAWTYFYGWYTAIVFSLLFNVFNRRSAT